MKKSIGFSLILVATIVVGWMLAQRSDSMTTPDATQPDVIPSEVAAMVVVEPVTAEEPPPTKVPVPATKASAPPVPQDVDGIERPAEWTEKTLAGTQWKGTGFDFSFEKDGTWHMAGRQASKWRVEGSRIKLFDGEGEIHYIDIEGDQLVFNGAPIGIPVARN